MEKIYTTLFVALAITQIAFAQSNTFPSSGNVGIGTTTPNNTLTVNGGITSISGSAITAAVPALSVFYDAINDKAGIYSLQNTISWKPLAFGAANFSFVSYGTNQGLYQDNFGKVGIGTTSPTEELQVNGAIKVTGVTGNNTASSGTLDYAGGLTRLISFGPNTSTKGGFQFVNLSSNGSSSGTPFTISTTGDATFSGQVGIGTSTPREALSVNGNIRSKQVKVELANWPDYVFKETYNLPSLSEVKKYIYQNHHLPEMPTQAEVEKMD